MRRGARTNSPEPARRPWQWRLLAAARLPVLRSRQWYTQRRRRGRAPIHPVKRAAHAVRPLSHHVRVDHRGLEVGMAQQLLHRADVVAILKQVGREAMAQRMATRRLADAGPAHSPLDGTLDA